MVAKKKLDIFKVLNKIDNKDYSFYDSLDTDEKKSFSAFLSLKWAVGVEGSNTIQHYYLASMNHHANRHLFDINAHPKLQWLTLVASSPDFGQHRHKWISAKGKKVTKSQSDVKAQLREIYPTYKEDEIDLLSTMVTKKELKQYVKDSGR